MGVKNTSIYSSLYVAVAYQKRSKGNWLCVCDWASSFEPVRAQPQKFIFGGGRADWLDEWLGGQVAEEGDIVSNIKRERCRDDHGWGKGLGDRGLRGPLKI